ncbi:MAG: ATP-dependent DNA helicase RecG [Patescibacteria group bacterium]|nr:ATP-dependent DNA helicase RecG [Patescibacteria group bacterium]
MPKFSRQDHLTRLHSIALKLEPDFKKLKIKNIGDLLWHFPNRYEDLSQIKKISELKENELISLKVKIDSLKSYRSWRKKIFITQLSASDSSGKIQASWFGQKFISQTLKIGDEIYLSGKAQKKGNIWTFTSPNYEKVKYNPLHSARLVPIYPLSGQISQKQLRFLMDRALQLTPPLADRLPAEIIKAENFPDINSSLQEIHFPQNEEKLASATARLKFQELFYLQCKYQLAKKQYQSLPSYSLSLNQELLNKILQQLPFVLTLDQQKALYDILADIRQNKPMNRLLEGDVGSGKTIVAFLAAFNTVSLGHQATLMAPTEILARQHFDNTLKILPAKFRREIALYTRSQILSGQNKKLSKKEINEKIKNRKINFVIGTHSLIQEAVAFDKLALVIIDEQHRFGVRQRKALKEKNLNKKVPHLLSMTATPIPRTLALTLYGDLDISLIKTKPAGRQKIKTFLVPEEKRVAAYDFLRQKIQTGGQAFVICPLIEDSDKLGLKSVKKEYKKLNQTVFPDLEIRMLHGKLKAQEKEKIMTDFKAGKFPILVASSVVEVGVDIPQASLMLIESAERFGLSQLHQFRGRIGRNNQESFCLLFTSDNSQLNKERLKALVKNDDGFELAQIDLELRGSGEIFGHKQSGLIKLKIARLTDLELIKKAQNWAKKVLANKKYLEQDNFQKIIRQLKQEMHLE